MNIFQTKDGKLVISQRPNGPIIIAFASLIATNFVEDPFSNYLLFFARTWFIIWGLLEVFWGVNTWRRLLGAAVIVYTVIAAIN